MEEEKVLLEEKGIIITNQRAIFGVSTYEISNIQSVERITVEQDEATKNKGCAMLLFGVIGFIFIIIHFFVINPSSRILYWDERILEILGYIFLLIAGSIFVIWKDTMVIQHIVRISDNNGAHDAYQSKDVALIDKIVKAINQAIIMRLTTRKPKIDTNS